MNGGQWTEQHELILKEWKAKCFVNLWLQDASSYYYTRMYNWMSYPVIVVSSLSSAALFSSSNEVIKYIVGVMTLSSAILTAITRQLKPGELHQQHALTTRRYHNLIRSIDTCISLTLPMRPPPDIFIEKIGVEIDNLATSQTDPPAHVIRSFESKYGPLDRMLYGEDIAELMRIEIQTNKMFKRMRKTELLSSEEPSIDRASMDYIRLPKPPPHPCPEPSPPSLPSSEPIMYRRAQTFGVSAIFREEPQSSTIDISKLAARTNSPSGKKNED